MLLSGRRVTISPSPKNVSARCRRCDSVSGKSIIKPSTEPPRSDGNGGAEQLVCELEPQLGGARAEALEPERALVEAVQRVLPGEPGAAVHLDRPLARGDGGLGGECLRSGRRHGRLLVVGRDAP